MKEHEKGEYHLDLIDEDEKLLLTARWDGCVDIRIHSNASTVSNPLEDEVDYIHICDLDEFIKQLLELKAAREKHWPQWFPET